MINSVNTPVQVVAVNSPVLFSTDRVKSRCCDVRHEPGSGRFILSRPGVYRVSFNGTISAAAVATAILNLTQDGEQVQGTQIQVGVGPTDIETCSFTTLIKVQTCGGSVIAVNNIGTTALNISNANIVIERKPC